ncbi:P-loop containing nucleoside triphosphate hydrolase protein [Epithele typhae]|uniref:P-loop containing nucleoside triphosphate hydrolase protein n=1 Tax=Epithele typhae TaxID=378194 RepID=UPI002007DAC0|nr:P-loop containing nucleoside triphosphate hydrolase protein [Epithele typhae]KAH9923714.1 P-loop containing nucleoside triphosphate hydrolase protein [Epithele typhae]
MDDVGTTFRRPQSRADAKKRSRYDSIATRQKMITECQKRVKLTPRKEQLDIAESMLLGLDSTSMAGTGWGRPSVCTSSTAIIISPLNVLELDQARKFGEWGLRAVAVNGETYDDGMHENIKKGKYDIVILGPELRLDAGGRFRPLLSDPQFSKRILNIIVDEAHCIAQWGDSFRPEYGQLEALRALVPLHVPKVRDALHISAQHSFHLNLGNDRPNISWEVRKMKGTKTSIQELGFLVPEDAERAEKLTWSIMFFNDIALFIKAGEWLRNQLLERLRDRVKEYNSQRGDLSKRLTFELFRRGFVDILIPTESAAWYGCDVPDIELVVQFMVPDSLTSVFQEVNKANCEPGDPVQHRKEIDNDLRSWIEAPENQCRREVADHLFDNPPHQNPLGACCDHCEREGGGMMDVDPPADPDSGGTENAVEEPSQDEPDAPRPRLWRSVVPITRTGVYLNEAVALLQQWRRRV